MKVLFALLALIAISLAAEVGLATVSGTSLDSAITGTVYFVQVNSTHVWVWPEITHITTNVNTAHGLHVHQFGDLRSTDGSSAGGHYVGAGTAYHACPENGTTRHEGDMGNWDIDSSGALSGQSKYLDLLALTGGSSIIGKAVVLHSQQDDCATQVTGNAGGRLAYGVVGIANPTYFPQEVINQITDSATTNTAISGDTTVTKAVAVLKPTTASSTLPNVTGIVTFEQTSSGLVISAAFLGLDTSKQGFGFHIHLYGDTYTGAIINGTSAGGHYTTGASNHSAPPDTNRHAGDLGNICTYDSAGYSYYQYTITDALISLNTNTNNILGRNIIVHALYDTALYNTAFGDRVAQGVIGVFNSTATLPTILSSSITVPADPHCLATTTTATSSTPTTAATSSTPTTAASTGNSPLTTTSSASFLSSFSALLVMLLALLF